MRVQASCDAAEEAADRSEVVIGALDEAHMARALDLDELTPGDSPVENAVGAGGRGLVLGADDDQRRTGNAAQVWRVVEAAVPGVREIAEDLRGVHRVLQVARWRVAGEVERKLHPQQL